MRVDARGVHVTGVSAGRDCKTVARSGDHDLDAAAADLEFVLHVSGPSVSYAQAASLRGIPIRGVAPHSHTPGMLRSSRLAAPGPRGGIRCTSDTDWPLAQPFGAGLRAPAPAPAISRPRRRI